MEGGKEERILIMRVDLSQKEDTSSFRAVSTLPPSDLFYLFYFFLLSLRLILFPSPSAALRSLHLPQARKPASRSDPLFLQEQKPTGWLDGWPSFRLRPRGEVFNFLPFSFPTGDSISVALALFYVASV
jgi:hypothetical protein